MFRTKRDLELIHFDEFTNFRQKWTVTVVFSFKSISFPELNQFFDVLCLHRVAEGPVCDGPDRN